MLMSPKVVELGPTDLTCKDRPAGNFACSTTTFISQHHLICSLPPRRSNKSSMFAVILKIGPRVLGIRHRKSMELATKTTPSTAITP
jgi:hypothetical protein